MKPEKKKLRSQSSRYPSGSNSAAATPPLNSKASNSRVRTSKQTHSPPPSSSLLLSSTSSTFLLKLQCMHVFGFPYLLPFSKFHVQKQVYILYVFADCFIGYENVWNRCSFIPFGVFYNGLLPSHYHLIMIFFSFLSCE